MGYPYAVRGATIYCMYGSHFRKMDMPVCHGSYIREKPVMHELDCKVGLDANIAPFGACQAPGNPGPTISISSTEGLMPVPDEKGNYSLPPMPVIGKLCTPILDDKWDNAHQDTLIDGVPALTVFCTITCKYQGVIGFIDDGQEVG